MASCAQVSDLPHIMRYSLKLVILLLALILSACALSAQINVKVPAAASGVSPLVISVGGVLSNTVQLVISAN
jgi:hypothetical protein